MGWEQAWIFRVQATNKNVTIQFDVASGGPAGGQTFEKFDKQVFS